MRCIRSTRGITKAACYDVVYEWEDIISKELKIPIYRIGRFEHLTICKIPYLFPKYNLRKQIINDKVELCFVLFVKELRYLISYNIIPIFLDVWGDKDIDYLINKVKKFSLFFVTSLDVYCKVLEKAPDCNVEYIPLSVSDEWRTSNIPKKKYDVIQIGRRNDVLHNYMLAYVKENPNVEYVYSSDGSTAGDLVYISTKRGNIGAARDRKQFMQMLQEAKISLTSSPAIDNSRKDAAGIDFPTPRFYESAISYCHMIGRYNQNEEFIKIKISEVCDYVDNYLQFSDLVTKYLNESSFSKKQKYDLFINEHLTSKLALYIKEKIDKVKKGE